MTGTRKRTRSSNGQRFTVDEWHGLYKRRWDKMIPPECMAHPAKFSFGLIDNIYKHCIAESWLTRGDTVLDPFAGVALGSLGAITRGIHWRGVELEPHNVMAANTLLDLWRYEYRTFDLGSAAIMRGDSQHLLELLPLLTNADARGVISSPPFLQQSGGTNVTATHGPLSDASLIKRHAAGNAAAHAYGQSDGQVQAMPEGDLRLALSSLPFSEMMASKNKGDSNRAATAKRIQKQGVTTKRLDVFTSPTNVGASAMMRGNYGGKSPSDGQLGSMPSNDLKSVISSPPFVDSMNSGKLSPKLQASMRANGLSVPGASGHAASYGTSEGQLGAASIDQKTFWSACAVIVAQVYALLPPGGHVVWVCKDYIRKGQRVPFSDNWRKLCEHAGLVTLHEHHAMLVEEFGMQATIDGPAQRRGKDRKSMFKRWQEKKGQTPIDWETVWCMVKP